MPNLYLPVSAAIISLTILVVYLSKKRLRVRENTLYLIMLFALLSDSVLVSAIFLNAYTYLNVTLITILNKIDYMCLFVWATCLFLYTYIVIHKNDENFKKKYKIASVATIAVAIVLSTIMWFLKVDIIFIDVLKSTAQGSAVYFSIVACVSFFIGSLIIIICNPKKVSSRVIPVFISLLITVTIAFLFTINPYLICISMGLTIVDLTMFFTIENPDMQMLEIINSAKDEAQRANQAKTDFLSSMSHEIRTPLNAIVGLSDCILNDENIDQAKSDAKDIIGATNTLLELVNGILDISKIEAGKMEIVEKEYDLTEAAENLAKLIKTRIGDKPIIMNTSFAKEIPGVLYGDEAKVKQIISNILTNAIKYTEKGTVDFSIRCANERNISHLEIRVKDTGRGMRPEQLENLFEKFRRFDEDKNSAIEGTGLGLAITKKLVEMLGGNIAVYSTYGEGTEFVVTLPQTIISLEKKKKEEESTQICEYPGKKVLLVDDTSMNITVESRILGFYKVDIDSAESGKECIEKCSLNKYDLILLDDMMPEMNGTETMLKLKENPDFKVPIVVLTANAIEGVKDEYLDAGFNDYLAKPIEKTELQRVLNNFLK